MSELFLCLGRGFSNFGGGREKSKAELDQHVTQGLEARGARVKLLGSYRGTGNFVLEATDVDKSHVTKLLHEILERPCLVVPVSDVLTASEAFAHWSVPAPAPGGKLTPGLALRISGATLGKAIDSTSRGHFSMVRPDIVAVYKIDRANPTEDRDNRQGGWGAISGDVATQVGGTWTARSFSTIAGLVRTADIAFEPPRVILPK